jgi:hypothetical protein
MREGMQRRLVMSLVLIFAFGAVVRTAAGIEKGDLTPAEALDRELGEFTIESQPLSSVFEALGERAGVSFVVDEDTYGMLPWGRETRLATVQMSGSTLRAALDEIVLRLGLAYGVGDQGIVIRASGPLKRMNRRSTWKDLDLLYQLNTTEYTPEAFERLKVQYRITSKVDAPGLMTTQLTRSGSGTLAQMLNVATQSLGWTWFPDNEAVVVLSAQAMIAHKLARTISARYNQMGLAHILVDLADKADVALFLEPGLMLKLPPTAQSYTLLLQQTSIRQALELICAETGLTYEIKREGLQFSLGEAAGAAVGDPGRRDAFVAKISVPLGEGGYSYEFLIRESELPSDIREYRRQMVDAMIERMRQDMAPTE